MSNHTPGPWTLKQDERFPFCLRTIDANGEEIAVRDLASWNTVDRTAEQANAREGNALVLANETLRAAAPELLAVAQSIDMLWALEWSSPEQAETMLRNLIALVADPARAAIAKATGQPS